MTCSDFFNCDTWLLSCTSSKNGLYFGDCTLSPNEIVSTFGGENGDFSDSDRVISTDFGGGEMEDIGVAVVDFVSTNRGDLDACSN